jgi:hypothetical protein
VAAGIDGKTAAILFVADAKPALNLSTTIAGAPTTVEIPLEISCKAFVGRFVGNDVGGLGKAISMYLSVTVEVLFDALYRLLFLDDHLH